MSAFARGPHRARNGWRPHSTAHLGLVAAITAAVVTGAALSAQPAGAQASHQLIQGSGSSWSANAINQWIADVQANGLQVVYTANGSAQGRKDFGYRSTDFAISDIGFQGRDPLTNAEDTPQGRAFAYIPIVAGGTSFPYQIRERGKLVRDLRLSGPTLAKIFTNKITDWSDPAITADNNGRVLPSLPIVPVVHSEGSGATAQFTKYLATQHTDLWRSFAGSDAHTEYYPRKGQAIAQNGADGVMNFVSSSGANGSIAYNEYSYALAKNYPVAKIQNKAGYFILPNQYNVAVALTQALINTDRSSPNYLLQDLGRVYVYDDPRTYPLSSYSYGIIPTAGDDGKLKTTAGRQTLADFLYYSICDGQKETGPIGYSPLPVNLVQAGFEQIARLKQADPAVDLAQRDVSTCRNPTFIAGQPQRNYLAEIAPQPAACDQTGQGPCSDTVDRGLTNPPAGGGGPGGGGAGGGGASGGGSSTNRSSTGGAASAGKKATGGASTAGGPSASPGSAPEGAAAPSSAATAPGAGSVEDVPLAIEPLRPAGANRLLPPLAAGLLLIVVIAPAILIRLFTIRPKEDA